jgi:uncharacterized alkaline shock family protein YloU
MTDTYQTPGKTTVSPEVLLTIARLTALNVPGVSRMCNVPMPVNRLLKKGSHQGEGVILSIEDDTVSADLHLIVNSEISLHEVSRNVQEEVVRAFEEMVGMTVGRVNVHVEDIDFPQETEG